MPAHTTRTRGNISRKGGPKDRPEVRKGAANQVTLGIKLWRRRRKTAADRTWWRLVLPSLSGALRSIPSIRSVTIERSPDLIASRKRSSGDPSPLQPPSNPSALWRGLESVFEVVCRKVVRARCIRGHVTEGLEAAVLRAGALLHHNQSLSDATTSSRGGGGGAGGKRRRAVSQKQRGCVGVGWFRTGRLLALAFGAGFLTWILKGVLPFALRSR